jgi:hypothetical protein
MFWTAALVALALAGPAPESDGLAWIERVGGDLEIELETREGREGPLYRSGSVATDTKLPVGYPAPTPPGAIELKHYPVVRRAEVSGTLGQGDPSMRGFFPLFRHITREGIAMTAPVEMEYRSGGDGDREPESWTMAFLYHTDEDGPTGEARGDVRVVDAPAVTVLSLGVRGVRSIDEPEERAQTLREWLEGSDGWRAVDGAPVRVLGYNGPNVAPANRWWEVQVVVERTAAQAE